MKKSSSGAIKVFRFDREPDTTIANETQSKPYAMMAAERTNPNRMRPRLNSADVSPFEKSKAAPARKCTFDFSAKKTRQPVNSSSSGTPEKKARGLTDDPELDSISQREDKGSSEKEFREMFLAANADLNGEISENEEAAGDDGQPSPIMHASSEALEKSLTIAFSQVVSSSKGTSHNPSGRERNAAVIPPLNRESLP